MDNWKLPWKGACLCGQVKMEITMAPVVSFACHCKGCQKLTSGPYSLTFVLPAAGFSVTEGAPVIGGMHGEHKQFYCGHCKGWLFTRGNGMDDFVNVRPAILDESSWVVPFADIAALDKLPSVVTGAHKSFDGFPELDAFGPMIAEFAKKGVRPS